MTSLLLVAHGTGDPEGVATVERLVAAVRAARPGLDVSLAFVGDVSPSPAAAFAAAAAAGVSDVVVLPLLLTPATHSKTDLPGSVQQARRVHPGLTLRYGRPLGPHPLLVQAVATRLAEVGLAGPDPTAGVVLAAAGAADPDANAEVARTARLLWEGRGWGAVEVAFASATTPTVDEAVRRLRLLGFTRVVVAPYFLAPGYFSRKVAGLAGDAVVAAVLGDHPGVVSLVLERYDEAVAGPVAMNCDACMFRVPFPGREHRVGEPQVPHDHPDD